MKKMLLSLVMPIFITTLILAQTPFQFKFQAVLRNPDGTLITNEYVTVDISILKDSITGTSVFDEQHNVTTTIQGIINLNIGSISDLSVIDWGSSNYYIQVAIDNVDIGTTQLLSVPYALYAEQTSSWARNIDTIYFSGEKVGIGTMSPQTKVHIYDDDATFLQVETGSTVKWAILNLKAPGDGIFQLSYIGNEAPGGGTITANSANVDAIAPGGLNIINEEPSRIAFFTNGYQLEDEKMRIDSVGRVGIGNQNPLEKLDIKGAIKIGDGGYTGITDGAVTPVPTGGAGTIIFVNSHFFGWNGTNWKQLD